MRSSRSAAAREVTTRAAAPSEICDAFPAVIVPSGRLRGCGSTMRGLGDRVLLLSRQRVAVVVSLRRFSHGAFVERARQSVKRQSIGHGPVAVPLTLARTNQQVGSLRHRLHTSSDDGVELSRADHLIASIPDRHTLLIVRAGIAIPSPPAIAA